MQVNELSVVREQIVDRRHKLEAAVVAMGSRQELVDLLAEVDAALQRLDLGTYGLCETCHEPIEADRLAADPLLRFCLDHLSPTEQRALEKDLQLAARIQRGLLPQIQPVARGWDIAYHYDPARIVSGDYCDVIEANDASYFMVGDVSGKGVAASTLMTHLHAVMRTLVSVHLPLDELLTRASRVFCESTLPMHYATLVCGRATPDGEVEICNAGHLPAIVSHAHECRLIGSTSLPIGMFCDQRFVVERFRVSPDDVIAVCTDGVTEAEGSDGNEYGIERLAAVIQQHRALPSQRILDMCIRDLSVHRSSERPHDDVTMMITRRLS